MIKGYVEEYCKRKNIPYTQRAYKVLKKLWLNCKDKEAFFKK